MKEFTLKREHILLLSNACTSWDNCEFGSPEIDPKRPYGNSDVYQDMLELLGLKEIKKGIYEFKLFSRKWLLKGEDKNNIYLDGADEETLTNELDKLHKETEIALGIILHTKSFKPGIYVADDYSDNWKKQR